MDQFPLLRRGAPLLCLSAQQCPSGTANDVLCSLPLPNKLCATLAFIGLAPYSSIVSDDVPAQYPQFQHSIPITGRLPAV
jgi:hypothetical protein